MDLQTKAKPSIHVVGAGNVGLHLYQQMLSVGLKPKLFGRNAKQINFHGLEITCHAQNKLHPDEESIVFLCLPDSEIKSFSADFRDNPALFVHVSGTVDIKEIQSNRKGVCYFFQSMSKEQEKVDFSSLKCYLEAEQEQDLALLCDLLKSMASPYQELSSAQRLKLHLSGVLVNNFGNQILLLCQNLLDGSDLSLDDLAPLYSQTFVKAKNLGAKKAQTGPALRGDFSTITKHREILDKMDPEWATIYQLFSKKISELKKD